MSTLPARIPPADTPPGSDEPMREDIEAWYEAQAELPEEKRWRPRNLKAAEWVMRKLADAHAVVFEADQLRADEIERWDEWRAQFTKEARRTIDALTPLLEQWALAQRELTDTKTFTLPYGEVATRGTQARFEITDHDRLLAFLRSSFAPEIRQEIVKTTERVQVSRLNPYLRVAKDQAGEWLVLTQNGERVPGVEYVPADVSVKVNVR